MILRGLEAMFQALFYTYSLSYGLSQGISCDKAKLILFCDV